MSNRQMISAAGMTATAVMLWWMILTAPAHYLALLAAVAAMALISRLIPLR